MQKKFTCLFFIFCLLLSNSLFSMELSSDEEETGSDIEQMAINLTYGGLSDEEQMLMDAVVAGEPSEIRAAIQAGANSNSFYHNPLAFAFKTANADLATFLKQNGASADVPIAGDLTLRQLMKNTPSQNALKRFNELFNNH
ncbi:MAG TPA: hypothetical protein VHO47_00860 [Candidatus Babeliales bacterium]|nr:hypothetical protein [Candidatus Babeliales bacterium]